MEYEKARKELTSELAGLKKTYRRNGLDRETAKYIAQEIRTIEQLLN
jgi:hypothetical protein